MARRSTAQNNYLEVAASAGGSVLNGLTDWTVGAWVYARSSMSTGNTAILTSVKPGTQDIPIMLGVSNNSDGQTAGRWVSAFYDDSLADWDFAQDTGAHEVGKWIFLVGQHQNGVALRLFKNGVFVSSGAVAGYGTTAQAFRVGHRWNSSLSTDYFDGLIEHAFVYGAVLSYTEILDLYKGVSPLDIRPTALKAYWPLTDGGGTALDLSSTQAHLTPTGTVVYEPGLDIDRMVPKRLPSIPDIGNDDNAVVYLDLQASGTEQFSGTTFDAATVNMDLEASSAEVAEFSDDATVYLDLQPSGVDIVAFGYSDAATVYLDLQVLGGECYSTFNPNLLGEGEAELQMADVSQELQFVGSAELQWSDGLVQVEGIDC